MQKLHRLGLVLSLFLILAESHARQDLLKLHDIDPEASYFEDSLLARQSDRELQPLRESLRQKMAKGDTLGAIRDLNSLSSIYTNRVDYAKSYDGYWQALLLADRIGDDRAKALSYNGLAILYSLFDRREEALQHYQLSLSINKALVESGQLDSIALRESYFPLAVHFKYEGDFERANAYLDSCENIRSPQNNSLFTQSERSHVLGLAGRPEDGKKALSKLERSISEAHPEYLPVYFNYLGDMYFLNQEWNESEASYLKAAKAAFTHQRHLNYVPDIYEKLAWVLEQNGKPAQANDYLKLANDINRFLYSSRSPKNRQLLEIKDEFRLEQQKARELAREQELQNLQQREEITRLQNSMLLGGVIFLISLGFFLFKYWKAKHLAERSRLEHQRKLENEKAQEIVQIKNQELTGTTLKMVAKDELIDQIKGQLKSMQAEPHGKELVKLIKTIDINKDQSWLDFENRFLALNEGFYERIQQLHPELKPYDLKVCALIKLDFSGKEMARLLGISPESANTSRYRLRKKLGLKKEDNLGEYIVKITSS
ncbi:tetratricopeptide repeat protein [Algoriphagus sp. H41]|uniref:Tetratricopeptide repeat protein n=1 Tax=Algoriphagus oliviformis TaxID=2811231 RepID=A0ABS3CA06_9BACT|nr:tetratricopeptide repeat protein [Algoriphagus oliviformis]MBN7813371.1 tetratricopeptide repeat protein [Algoriphagus oliviformis]